MSQETAFEAAAATRSAFEAFYRRHYPTAARLAYALSGSTQISDDITQDAFLAIEPRFGSIEHPEAYLRTTLIRLNIDHARRRRRRERRLHDLGVDRLYGDQAVGTEARELFDVLARLPHRQRVVLTLRYWCGLTFAEIAAAMGSREGTVKSAAHRGLRTLRRELEEER